MGTQEIIIYRLVVINLNYYYYFLVLTFWTIIGGKMGVATTRTSYGSGPPAPTKKLAHRVDPWGQPLSRNHVFEIFRDEPPPPKQNTNQR